MFERSKDTVIFSFDIYKLYDVIREAIDNELPNIWLILADDVWIQTAIDRKRVVASVSGSTHHIKDKNYTRVEEIPTDNFVIHMIGNTNAPDLKKKKVEVHYFYDNTLQVFLIYKDDVVVKISFDIDDM